MADDDDAVLQPRPYPFPLPVPPPPIPQELAAPIRCVKCHSPDVPLPGSDSPEMHAADSALRQTLAATWRSQIDRLRGPEQATRLEYLGLVDVWLHDLIEHERVPVADLAKPETIEKYRIQLRQVVARAIRKLPRDVFIERITYDVIVTVLVRMNSLGFDDSCFHDILQMTPQIRIAPHVPPAVQQPDAATAANVAVRVASFLDGGLMPRLEKHVQDHGLSPDHVRDLLAAAVTVWQQVLLESCKREYHKELYDVQLMMVGGYAVKLLELGWKELPYDDAGALLLDKWKSSSFSNIAKWVAGGGVRVALWEKGERERIQKERLRLKQKREADEAEKKRQDLDRKRKAEEELERQRCQDRYEEVLGRLISIEKQRRALLEESVKLEEERTVLEERLNHRSPSPAPTEKETVEQDIQVTVSEKNVPEVKPSVATLSQTEPTDDASSQSGASMAREEPSVDHTMADRVFQHFTLAIQAKSSSDPADVNTEDKSNQTVAAQEPSQSAKLLDVTEPPPSIAGPAVKSARSPVSHAAHGDVHDLSPYVTEVATGNFIQGSSRDLDRLAVRSFYNRSPRPVPADPAKKGKGLAPIVECTCGADSRYTSPSRKSQRAKRMRAQANRLSKPFTEPAPAPYADKTRYVVPNDIGPEGSRRVRIPHVCTVEEHTFAVDDQLSRAPDPYYVDNQVMAAIDRLFFLVLHLKLYEVAKQQLSLMFHMSTPNMLAIVWKIGGDPRAYLEGGRDEARAVDHVIAELARVASTRQFQDRAGKLALKSTFASIVRQVSVAYHKEVAPQYRGVRGPCMCVLQSNPDRLVKLCDDISKAAKDVLATHDRFMPLDSEYVARLVSPMYSDMLSKGSLNKSRFDLDTLRLAHVRAYKRFRARFAAYFINRSASVKQLTRLVRLHDAQALWRMALMQHAAADTAEPRASFVESWSLIEDDPLIRQDLAALRSETTAIDSQAVSSSIMERVIKAQNGLSGEKERDDERDIAKLSLAIALHPHQPRLYLARAVARSHLDRPWQVSQIIYDCTMALVLPAGLSEFERSAALSERGLAFLKLGRTVEGTEDLMHHPALRAERAAHRDTIKKAGMPPPAMLPLTKMVCPVGICQRPFNDCNSVDELHRAGPAVLRAYMAAIQAQAHLHFYRQKWKWLCEAAVKKTAQVLLAGKSEALEARMEAIGIRAPLDYVASADVVAEWLQTAAKELVQFVRDQAGDEPVCVCTLNDEHEEFLELALETFNSRTVDSRLPDWSDMVDNQNNLSDKPVDWIVRAAQTVDPGFELSSNGDVQCSEKEALQHLERLYTTFKGMLEERIANGSFRPFFLESAVLHRLQEIGGAHIWVVIGSASPTDRLRSGEWDDLKAWAEAIHTVAFKNGRSHPMMSDSEFALDFYQSGLKRLEEDRGELAIQAFSLSLAFEMTPLVLFERAKTVERLLHRRMQGTEAYEDLLRWIARDCTHAIARGLKFGEAWALRAKATYSLSKPEHAYHDMLRGVTEDPVDALVHQLVSKAGIDIARTPELHKNLEPGNFVAPAQYLTTATALLSVVPLNSAWPIPLLMADEKTEAEHDDERVVAEAKGEHADLRSHTPSAKATERVHDPSNILAPEQLPALLPDIRIPADAASQTASDQPASTVSTSQAWSRPWQIKRQYYEDPRLACPPIRCSGTEPVVANLDQLEPLLLDIFLLAYKIELPDCRAQLMSRYRNEILQKAITEMAWEKRDLDSRAFVEELEQVIAKHLDSEFEAGSKRAHRSLEFWMSAILLAIKSLTQPSQRASPSSRDCCICLLSASLDSVQVVQRVLAKRAELVPTEPVPLNKPDMSALANFCRNEVKKGVFANRGGIWRSGPSAPKWKFAIERFATKFEKVFESLVNTKFASRGLEEDYPAIARLVGGIATFEAAHRLLMHPDPVDAATPQRSAQSVEDMFPWAAFVAANAPYSQPLNDLGDVKTIGLATSKVDEATRLFREAKYLEAIRAYSVAAIWAGDRSGRDLPGVERKFLRDEARRTLKSGIYAQLSYLRTLFPSNRQWMNAVADATLAIACAQKAELPAALDLRSTALHGIRQYKFALSDLEDAALLDPSKCGTWNERFVEMDRLVPDRERIHSRFNTSIWNEMAGQWKSLGLSKETALPELFKFGRISGNDLSAPNKIDESAAIARANENTSSIETAFATLEEASVLNSYISGALPTPINGHAVKLNGHSDSTDAFAKLTKAAADHISMSASGPSLVGLTDERLACSPVRHNVDAVPDSSQIGAVSHLLREIFLLAHSRCRHQGFTTVLTSIELEWFDQFLRSGLLERVENYRASNELADVISSHIAVMLERMRHPSTIAAWGQAFVTQALSWMSQLLQSQISDDHDMPPCICTLTNSVPALQRILDILQKGPVDNVPPDQTPVIDLPDTIAKVRSAIDGGVLNGSLWKTEDSWRNVIVAATSLFHKEFSRVVEVEWRTHQPWLRGTLYDAVATSVGGAAIWDRAIRIGLEIEERHDGYRETTPEKARARSSTFALSGWSEYVSGGAFVKSILEVQKKDGSATAGAHGTKIADECFAAGRVEEALSKYICLSMAFSQDPFIWVKLARCRLAMPGKYQRHEAIADCTFGLAHCSAPGPALPRTAAERDGHMPSTLAALPSQPEADRSTSPTAGIKSQSFADPTSYARADLLLLRAKALTQIERFGLALYDLEALSSSLRREHTSEADTMIKSIKAWISQEQRGLQDLQREARDAAALHSDDEDTCSCCQHGHSDEEVLEEE
ncbi:hypothetical protein OIV83_002140 [Microbotryomycetes sp. JL201]|nr:hypothetical protein OIV83_002140 [Microbotryomycetes sp. JL201]